VEFGTRYGFLIEELRLLARGTVVIDAKGVVQYVEYVPDVSMEPDTKQPSK
jgi:thiol peroxidase